MQPGPDKETDRLRRALEKSGRPSSDYDLNPEFTPAADSLRPAGVLVLLVSHHGRPGFVLTRRSPMLRHHPGQVAFPGGKVDPGDGDEIGAALRESREEVGLPDGATEILGALPPHRTVTGFRVTPVVARLTVPFTARAEPGEVDEIFVAPFDLVMDPASFAIEARRWRGTRRAYFTIPWGPYYIWGATARMLKALADRVGA